MWVSCSIQGPCLVWHVVCSGYLPCCLSLSFEKNLFEILFGFEEQLSQINHTYVSMCWDDVQGKKIVFFRQAWISKFTLKVQTWVLLNLFSPTHKIWDPQIRNPWSFSCRKLSSTVLCKLEQCWQMSQRYRPAMDSAGRFSLTQKLIDSPGETCGSFTFHVRTARARFEWSQALLQCVLAYSHVVTEPKPHSPTDTRLAYAVLILDHMFLKSHNRFSCLRPLFKSGVQIRIHCFVPVYPWTLWYCLFAPVNYYSPHSTLYCYILRPILKWIVQSTTHQMLRKTGKWLLSLMH